MECLFLQFNEEWIEFLKDFLEKVKGNLRGKLISEYKDESEDTLSIGVTFERPEKNLILNITHNIISLVFDDVKGNTISFTKQIPKDVNYIILITNEGEISLKVSEGKVQGYVTKVFSLLKNTLSLTFKTYKKEEKKETILFINIY